VLDQFENHRAHQNPEGRNQAPLQPGPTNNRDRKRNDQPIVSGLRRRIAGPSTPKDRSERRKTAGENVRAENHSPCIDTGETSRFGIASRREQSASKDRVSIKV